MNCDNASSYFERLSGTQLAEILGRYDRTVKSFDEDVDVILNWIKLQPHLPQNILDKQIVSSILLIEKCSVEKTKQKIDGFFTMHSMFPEIFKNIQPWGKTIRDAQKMMYAVAIPKLTENCERIYVMTYKENTFTDYELNPITSLLINVVTLTYLDDFVAGYIYIWDMKHFKLSYAKALTPSIIKKCVVVFEKAFSAKNNGIHFVNIEGFMSSLLFAFKTLLKPKIRERVFIQNNIESLSKSISKSFLPKDYGGEMDSLEELEKKQNERFELHREFFEKREQWLVKEDLRPQKTDYDDILGIQGNFKKLDID